VTGRQRRRSGTRPTLRSRRGRGRKRTPAHRRWRSQVLSAAHLDTTRAPKLTYSGSPCSA
jgi:hypothetical protein